MITAPSTNLLTEPTSQKRASFRPDMGSIKHVVDIVFSSNQPILASLFSAAPPQDLLYVKPKLSVSYRNQLILLYHYIFFLIFSIYILGFSLLWPVKILSTKESEMYFLLGLVNDIPKVSVNL